MPHYVWQRGQVGEQRSSGAVASILHSSFCFGAIVSIAAFLLLDSEVSRGVDAGWLALVLGQGVWISVFASLLLLNPSFLETLDGRPLGRLGWPNQLTLSRIYLLPLMLALILRAHFGEALVLYAVLASTDVADGILARRSDGATKLGFVLDPLADILFNLGIFSALSLAGALPWWVGALVILRYGILLVGCAVLYGWKGEIWIRPTFFGKATGFLVALLTTGLFVLLAMGGTQGALSHWTGRSIGVLVAIGVFHVVVMGWINIRRPNQGGTAVYRRSFGLLVGRNPAPRGP